MSHSKSPVFYLNGKLVPDSKAKVTVRDRCFLYGDGIYDTFIIWNGWPYKLDDHLERMLNSMRIMVMNSPFTKSEMRKALIDTIEANQMTYGYIRFQISRGVGLLSDKWNQLESGPNSIIIPYDIFKREDLLQHCESGYSAVTTSIRKIPQECLPAQAKHCNYLNNVLGAIERTRAGADIGIMLGTDGCVREGLMYSVFLAKDNIIYTPALGNILPGVTRKAIVGLARKDGYQVIEKENMDPGFLYSADEIFISAVSKSCISITRMDRRKVGNGGVGLIAKRIRQLLFADMDKEAKKNRQKLRI
jgi:branched-chain amino acid aminotransferase